VTRHPGRRAAALLAPLLAILPAQAHAAWAYGRFLADRRESGLVIYSDVFEWDRARCEQLGEAIVARHGKSASMGEDLWNFACGRETYPDEAAARSARAKDMRLTRRTYRGKVGPLFALPFAKTRPKGTPRVIVGPAEVTFPAGVNAPKIDLPPPRLPAKPPRIEPEPLASTLPMMTIRPTLPAGARRPYETAHDRGALAARIGLATHAEVVLVGREEYQGAVDTLAARQAADQARHEIEMARWRAQAAEAERRKAEWERRAAACTAGDRRSCAPRAKGD
jgi:hypothetical protein